MNKKTLYILLYVVAGLIVYYLIYKYWYLPKRNSHLTGPPTTATGRSMSGPKCDCKVTYIQNGSEITVYGKMDPNHICYTYSGCQGSSI